MKVFMYFKVKRIQLKTIEMLLCIHGLKLYKKVCLATTITYRLNNKMNYTGIH